MANPTKAFGLRAPQAEGHTSFHTQNFSIASASANMKPGVALKINRSTGELEVVDAASVTPDPIDYVIQSLTDSENKPVPILNTGEAGIVQALHTKTYPLFEIQADAIRFFADADIFEKYTIIPGPGDDVLLDSDRIGVPDPSLEAVGFGNRIPAIEEGFNPIVLVRIIRFTP